LYLDLQKPRHALAPYGLMNIVFLIEIVPTAFSRLGTKNGHYRRAVIANAKLNQTSAPVKKHHKMTVEYFSLKI
jgi:hypothetical protein